MFSLFGCGKIGQVMDGDGMILKINGEEYHSGGHSRTETDYARRSFCDHNIGNTSDGQTR